LCTGINAADKGKEIQLFEHLLARACTIIAKKLTYCCAFLEIEHESIQYTVLEVVESEMLNV